VESSYDDTSKKNQSFINHSFCEVTDSILTNCKNDMWTEIINPCRVRTIRMPQMKPVFFGHFSVID